MATAKELKSGSWFIRVYDKETKQQVCFTSKLKGKAGKAEAELMAREYLLGKRQKREKGKTVGECIDEYINLKENILSPTTIAEYRRCRKGELSDICNIYVSEINSLDVQKLVNKLSMTKQPKTVRNAHGLLASVLNVYSPNLRLNTTLPKVQRKIKQLPDVQDIIKVLYKTDIELPCLLAMWCSLRMSEVRGIKKTDIKKGILTVHNTKVRVNNQDVEKDRTKTIASTRQIALPNYILNLINELPEDQEYITTLTGQALYMRFSRLLERNDIEHISFHGLRHMNASIMVALNIPEKYAMERGGWSSPQVLQSVYQHTFSAERQIVDQKIDAYFYDIINDIKDDDKQNEENK